VQYRGTELGQATVVSGTTSYTDTYLYNQEGSPLELLRQQAGVGGTQRYWNVLDGRGNVVALTDATGTVVDRYSNDLWGAPTSISETVVQPLRYAGYWYDRELGWYWLSVRSYDPVLKRFLQPDPSMQDGTLSYVYVGDDPVDGIDPMGLGDFEDDLKLLEGILSAAELLRDALGAIFGGGPGVGITGPQWTGSDTASIDGYTVGAYRTLTQPVNRGNGDAHHIIQNAAFERKDRKGKVLARAVAAYREADAPAVLLQGPSTLAGTPHYRATRFQENPAGLPSGTYGRERVIGFAALISAGVPRRTAARIVLYADTYFLHHLGISKSQVTFTPGN
jgi:RHS repeat-associated protein